MPKRTAGIKIVSIGAALLLWMFIKGGEEAEWVFQAPLSVEGIQDGLVLVGEIPDAVIFEARGSMKTLASLKFQERRSNIQAAVNVAFLGRGEHREDITEDNVALPPASEIIQLHIIAPKAVQFELDTAMTTELKVVPRVSGDPPEGYYYIGTTVEPEVVSIRGARSLLRGAKVVFTEEIDLSAGAGTFEQSIGLDLAELGRAVSEPEEVVAKIEVDGTLSTTFENVQGRLLYDEENLTATASPPTFAITVSGAESRMEGLTDADIGVVVDAAGLGAGTHQVTPQISLPDGISLVSLQPAIPEVTLEQTE